MIYRIVTTNNFSFLTLECGEKRSTRQDQSERRELNWSHTQLTERQAKRRKHKKKRRYLCHISMQMTSNIIQIYFMVACHTNICYPIHLALCYSSMPSVVWEFEVSVNFRNVFENSDGTLGTGVLSNLKKFIERRSKLGIDGFAVLASPDVRHECMSLNRNNRICN